MLFILLLACSESTPPTPPPTDLPVPAGMPSTSPAVAPEAPVAPPAEGNPAEAPTTAPTATPTAMPTTVPTAVPTAVPAPNVAPPAAPPATPASQKSAQTPPASGVPTPENSAAASPAPVAEAPAAPAPAALITYQLNPAKGWIYAQVFKDPTTVAAGLSHDHIMVASGWNGTVSWQADDPSKCAIDIHIPVEKLQNDAPSWRQKVGYDTTLSDSERAEVRDHMLSAGQLNAATYPEMRFVSSACSAAGDKIKVTGQLTIHGKSKTVSLNMQVHADANSFSASGSLSAKQTDFGITPFSALLGSLKNKDEIKIVLNVEGSTK